ncbi:MAG: hypothetical protein GKS00_02030 [Alphaproteobacteria bacterium]|nr:hypothetical protein [Alphaproteobacteria bacterium]
MRGDEQRKFSLCFAAWKAARLLPKGKRRGEGVEAYGVFLRAFEAQLGLSGYRVIGS